VFNLIWEDVGAGQKQCQHKRIKGVNTTIHMGISHHAFSLYCIQVPANVLVSAQFLSCCCSGPPGIEALFVHHSWLEVLFILLVSKKGCLGGHFD